MKKFKLIFWSLILFSLAAQAYYPKFDYIVSRTAALHGSGIYLIDQDVTITGANHNPITLHEQWLVEGAKSLRVRVTGKNELNDTVGMTFLYNDQNRYTIDENGKREATKVSEEFVEPLFHFRTPSYLKALLYKLKIIPRSALADAPRIRKVEDIKHSTEDFVRLSRSLGVVNYAIGTKPNVEMAVKLPQLWIEQDFFHIRKWRTPQEALVLADKYQQHRNNFWFPQMREVRWNDNRAIITVTQVKSLSSSAQIKQRFSLASFDLKKEPELQAKKLESELFKEFYSRFR